MSNQKSPSAASKLYIMAFFLVLYEFTTYSSNDMIMPGMVKVIKEFHAPLDFVVYSLIFYILGNTLLTPIIGPLAERFGKRQVILSGNLIFLVTSGILIFVANRYQFLLIRTIEGVGLSVIAIGYTIIHENFDDKNAVKITALMTNMAVLAPLLGPMFGAVIVSFYSWRLIFIIVTVLSLLTMIMLYFYLPQNNKNGSVPKDLSLANVITSYKAVLKHRNFQLGLLLNSLLFLPSLAWIGMSPIIILEKLKLGYTHYVLYQIVVIGGFSISSLIIQFISGRIKIHRFLVYGGGVIIVAIILSAMSMIAGNYALDLVILSLGCYGIGNCLCGSIVMRIIMSEKSYSTNYAVSILSFCQMIIMLVGLSLFNQISMYFNYSIITFSVITIVIGIIVSILIRAFANLQKTRAWN